MHPIYRGLAFSERMAVKEHSIPHFETVQCFECQYFEEQYFGSELEED
jgi:hypothetical protein